MPRALLSINGGRWVAVTRRNSSCGPDVAAARCARAASTLRRAVHQAAPRHVLGCQERTVIGELSV